MSFSKPKLVTLTSKSADEPTTHPWETTPQQKDRKPKLRQKKTKPVFLGSETKKTADHMAVFCSDRCPYLEWSPSGSLSVSWVQLLVELLA